MRKGDILLGNAKDKSQEPAGQITEGYGEGHSARPHAAYEHSDKMQLDLPGLWK